MSKLRKHDYTLDGSDWDLSLSGLKEPPVDDLKKNPKARRIDLSNNAITKLPPTFTSLTHLIDLDLSRNRLQELPQDFGQLSKLLRLDLYGNQLKTLPISFGQLSRLKWLDLKDNPLEPTLARVAGDCTDERQCQLCAINCLKFMKSEKLRIDYQMRVNEEKVRQRQHIEKQLEDKNKKERERKRAKNARRSARKAQQVVNDEDNGDEDNESNAKINDKSERKSSVGFVLSFVGFLMRLLLILSLVLFFLFIGLSFGLYLQNGHKLETIEDMRSAFNDCFESIQNPKEFTKETKLLAENIVKGLRNWRKSFNIFENKQNFTKN